MKRKIPNNNLITAAACFFAVCMVAFPNITESGSKSAIIIWANSIVPILLPFFIFADFIKRVGNPERLPLRIYPFIIAFMSGYPVGAKAVGDLVKSGSLSADRGIAVLSYSLVTGPAFILGTIGAFLGSYRAAFAVAVAHYTAAILNGIFYRCENKERKSVSGKAKKLPTSQRTQAAANPLESFSAAISSGFKSMAVILAYLIIFMIAIDLLEAAGVFGLLKNEALSSTAKGLLEMTAGSSMLGMCDINLKTKTMLSAFIVSFGGLSVIGQSVSMTAGSGIRPFKIFEIKLTHGLLAGIIAMIFSLFMLK